MSHDEAVASLNSTGSLYETRHATRCCNTSPILYPLALYGIQRIERSELTIRLIPAAASVLTVAALLFLLPWAGISRQAAFIAALLAAVSAEAIFHARDAREYSVDALLAVLLIAGLLLYLRDRRKVLLSAALFLSPLVQYGLVILGIAALATAFIAPRDGAGIPPVPDLGKLGSYQSRLWAWLRARLDLTVPGVSFLAGCAATWQATLRHHHDAQGWGSNDYLAEHYFDRDGSLVEAATFAVFRIWDTLAWHLPVVVAALTLAAFGALLLRSAARRRVHPILVVTLLTLGIAAILAVVVIYPLGGTRQTIYLSPLLFLTAGLAFAETAGQLAAYARKEWLGPATLAGLGLLIALAGIATIRESGIYARKGYEYADFYAGLKERFRPDDAVYAAGILYPRTAFYWRDNPAWPRRWRCANDLGTGCARETVNLLLRELPTAQRIWLLHSGHRDALSGVFEHQTLQAWEARGIIKPVAVGSDSTAYLMGDTSFLDREYQSMQEKYRAIAAGQPRRRADFDLYVADNSLYLLKELCTAADVTGAFTVDIIPIREEDLSVERRRFGSERRHFLFQERGSLFDGKCLAMERLPNYSIAELKLHRFLAPAGVIWKTDLDLKPDYYSSAYREIVAGEPAARGVFDLYLKDDTLYYYKAVCAAEDRASRFFLHFVPVVASDLPAERRAYGVGNGDFDFAEYGTIFDGKCLAAAALPDYPVAAIRSGQFILGAERLWETEFYLDLTEHYRAAYPALTANPPAAREGFDLYLEADRLHYVKEDCSAADTEARFLLHFVPVEVGDLPAERREYGSENRDFDFAGRGARFGGKCMATVGLPDYPVAAIRTGQFVIGEPPLWTVAVAVGAAADSR